MPNPIIGVFSDIPQSSETSAGSSAAQNTQRYKEIEQIAKYNRENNTNFYTLAQIQEHQKKLKELERAKAVASNPDPEDVRDAYISALNPQATEDVDKIRKWDKDAATTTAIGTAVGTLPFWGPTAAHVLGVLANPATASTTFGSLAATGADIAGMYAGAKGLFSDANKIASGNYSWKDVPMTGLNLIGFTPGASVLTRAGNWRTAISTGTNAYNTAKGWAPIFTNKQYWQALPGNTKSLITTLTPSGKRRLQSIADDTYAAMANRVEGIAKNSKFPNTKDVGIEAGFPEKSLITARGDFGNPTIRADVTNPDLMEFFGAKPLNTKVNYTFSLDPNSVQMAGFRGTDGIQINRAHFLFPFKSSSGEWKMLNVNGMNGNPYTLVGHEAGHAAMAQINPLKGIKPFKLNGTNFTINKENELFHSGKDFSSLLSKAGTHDGLPEEYLADYFGELASRGLPQNTDWNLIPETTKASIIESISKRRSMPQSGVQQLLNGLSDYGYIGSKPIEIPQLTGHFGQVKYYGPTMGKTTAAKSNPKLVDFDDIIRQPSRSILDRFGFKNKAEMYNSGNQEAIKAYEDMLVKSLRDWRANPENSNLTLVASPTAIANPTKTGFYFDNMPSIPSRSVFIARNVGRGGTPEASAMWYDSLMEKNPNLKIDNRFVSEIEKQAYITPNTGYKSIFMEEPIMSSSKRNPLFEHSIRMHENSEFGDFNPTDIETYSNAKNKGSYLDRTYDGRYALNVKESFNRRNATGDARVNYMKQHPVTSLEAPGVKTTLTEQLQDASRDFAKKYANDFDRNWNIGVEYNAKLKSGDVGETEGVILGRGFNPGDKPIRLAHSKDNVSPITRITENHEMGHATGNYDDAYIYNRLKELDVVDWGAVSPYFKNADRGEIGQHLAEIPDYLGYRWDPNYNSYVDAFGNLRKINPTQIRNYMQFATKSGFPQNKTILGNIKNMKEFSKFLNEHPFAITLPIVGIGLGIKTLKEKQGGKIKSIFKAQNGDKIVGISPVYKLIPKKLFELVAKRSNMAQVKSIPTIIGDVITGRDKSFYNENNINGSNEIDTYLYGKPYNSIFTGDASVGPDYTNYINKNYPGKDIKTYNTHFGDTLYIDNKVKSLVEKQLNNGEVVGGSMGRYAHAPSYIVTKEEGRPYDAGGHLMKFSRDKDGNIVANMSDIYDFLPEDFNEKYDQTENPAWTRNLANNIGTPFIVRQNNIPVRFKEIVPEYKTDKQRELGDFLSQWGNMYDLKLPLRLTDSQIDEIFDGRDYGDDILDFMISKGYINPQQ